MVKGKKIFSNEPARLILEVKRADEHLIIYGHDRIPNITLAKGGSPYQNKSRFTNPIDLDNINAKKEKRKTAQEENEYFAVAQSPQTEINTIPPIALAFCPLKLKKTRTARTLKKLFTTTVNWVLKCRSKITNATA